MNSVLSTLKVFEEVALRQPIGVSELARTTDMPKSSVHRCLMTLQTAGWLRIVDAERVHWGLTMKALALGLRGAGEQDFRHVAGPVVRELSRATGETVFLGLRDGHDYVIATREDSSHLVRVFLEVGRRLPLRVTSAGVAIMARLDDADIDEILEGESEESDEFPAMKTDEVRAEIESARVRGYAANISSSWYRPQVASLGAAITNAVGRPIGAVVVSVPEARVGDDHEATLSPLVIGAAQEIGRLVSSV